jgi:DNA-binding GntR family transcriptional regulator
MIAISTRWLRQHVKIVKALARKDRDKAEQLMGERVGEIKDELKKAIRTDKRQ